MRTGPTFGWLALLSIALVAAPGTAQDSSSVSTRYAKTEYRLAMRDGKRLFLGGSNPDEQPQAAK